MIGFISIAVGLLLIFIEFFVPGGIFAVFGLLAIFGGIALFIYEGASLAVVVSALLGSLIGSILTCYLALWVVRRTGKSGSIFLTTDQEGFRTSSYDPALKERVGIAHTDLKPGGFVMIDGVKYAAYAPGGFVERGTKVIVVDVEGETIKVRKVV